MVFFQYIYKSLLQDANLFKNEVLAFYIFLCGYIHQSDHKNPPLIPWCFQGRSALILGLWQWKDFSWHKTLPSFSRLIYGSLGCQQRCHLDCHNVHICHFPPLTNEIMRNMTTSQLCIWTLELQMSVAQLDSNHFISTTSFQFQKLTQQLWENNISQDLQSEQKKHASNRKNH